MPKLPTSAKAEDTLEGSEQQQAIWLELLAGERHVICNAVAGSGKTTTGVEYCKRDKDTAIAYVAFNKHIQSELARKIQQPNVETMTYHALGYRAIRESMSHRVELDQFKTDVIIERLVSAASKSREAYITARTRKLVSLAKQYGMIERADLETLVDHHLLDLNGIEEEVYELVPQVLIEAKADTHTVDYDDMVWLPKELNLNVPHFETMIIDEAQDTNLSQQWLALHASDRLVGIGDSHQAIYGFRGSDAQSMNRIKSELMKTARGVIEMPLTLTRRCPKSHVRLAQRIVPEIEALGDAPEGIVRTTGEEAAVREMMPGDLVLCRVNAELIKVAYQLIRRNVKAVIRGRDIGEGIVKLLESARKRTQKSDPDIGSLMKAAYDLTREQQDKYLRIKGGKGAVRAAAVMDRYECLGQLAEDATSAADIKSRVEKIFGDFEDDGRPRQAVVLGTVHRTKGLEAHRVYILKPNLIPHPMARQPWEREQERNLAYVAVTRAMYSRIDPDTLPGELIFVGRECPLFV